MKYQYLRINPLAYLICVMNKFRVGKTHPEKNQGGSKPTLPTLFRRPCVSICDHATCVISTNLTMPITLPEVL